MERYTEILDYEASNLSPDNDLYEEKLLGIASIFRTFSEAFTQSICSHGYTDHVDNITAKVDFLRNQFKIADINPPCDIKDWFSSNKALKHEIAFQVCFASALNVDDTNDFFRRIIFERSFDCHAINEAVYYFCIRNGLTYKVASRWQNVQGKPSGGADFRI